jgi:hypothetical protein
VTYVLQRLLRISNPSPGGFWCEVTIADLECRSREWTLAGYRAPDARLARLWLRWQTQRLADLIDPDPGAPWLTGLALHRVERPDDPATALRHWPSDAREYARLQRAAAEGSAYQFSVTDDSLRFTLTNRPLPTGPHPRHARPRRRRA